MCELVRGATVCLRDHSALPVPVHDWLVAAADSVDERSPAERLETVHPADQLIIQQQWSEVLARPGGVVEYTVRTKQDGVDLVETVTALNLLDDPVVGAVVYGARSRPAEVPHPVVEPSEEELVSTPKWALVRLDASALIVEVEGLVEEAFGLGVDQMRGRVLSEFLHAETLPHAVRMWADLLGQPGDATRVVRQRVVQPDGSDHWFEATVMKRAEADGSPLAVTVLLYDIAERRAQDEALRSSREQFRSLAEDVPTPVFQTDLAGRVVFGNGRWREFVESVGATPTDLRELVHPEDWPAFARELDELAAVESGLTLVHEVRTRGGDLMVSLHCRIVGLVDGKPTILGTLHDVTSSVELRDRVQRDPLTGVLNRAGIDDALGTLLVGDQGVVVVVFIDLDGFKGVNDTFGHEAGDVVLQVVADRLRNAVRPNDLVGRYGGDEFVAICLLGDDELDLGVTDRLERVLDEPIAFPGGTWAPSASFGVHRAAPGEAGADVLRSADLEMFTAKRRRKTIGL